MKIVRITTLLFIFTFQCLALTPTLINSAQEIIKKYGIEESLSDKEKFNAYNVLAFELENHGYLSESLDFYEKAINLKPKDIDPIELQTSYLFALYRSDEKKARAYYPQYKNALALSKDKKKEDILKFWKDVFTNNKELHSGFYGQFFKDKSVKELMNKKEYAKALALKNPKGLEHANINAQIEYDVLSRLNGKKNGFYCGPMLNKFKNSYAITMEICRYIKTGKLKYKGLPELIERTKKDASSLNHVVVALKDIVL